MSIARGERLRLSLTAQCPLRCGFCHGDGNTSPALHAKELSAVAMDHIVSVIRVAAEQGMSTIRFTGGEPGQYRYFNELMQLLPQLRKRHVGITKWGLTTAGLPFRNEYKRNILAKSALTDIAVSVDSIEKGERSRPSSPVGVPGRVIFSDVVEPLIEEFSGLIKINVVFDGNHDRAMNVIRYARQLKLNITVLEVNRVMGQRQDVTDGFRQLRQDVIQEFGLENNHCDSLNEHYLHDRTGREIMKFYPDHCGSGECGICGDLDMRIIPDGSDLGVAPCYEQDQGHAVPLVVDGKVSAGRFLEAAKLIGIGPHWSQGTRYESTRPATMALHRATPRLKSP